MSNAIAIEQKEQPATTNWFATNEVLVPVTIGGFSTMKFPMREILTDEETETRTKHFALTEKEQNEKSPKFNLDLFLDLLNAPPQNPIPGFPVLDETIDWKSDLRKFFTAFASDIEKRKKQDFVLSVMSIYWKLVQPIEFFR